MTYADLKTEALLGDVVRMRRIIRWHFGRVAYLPGVSPLNPELEHSGLKWVGIRFDDESITGALVIPEINALKPNIQFIRRDPSEVREIKPTDRFEG